MSGAEETIKKNKEMIAYGMRKMKEASEEQKAERENRENRENRAFG